MGITAALAPAYWTCQADYKTTKGFSGFPALGIQWQRMESDALRKAYGMGKGRKGGLHELPFWDVREPKGPESSWEDQDSDNVAYEAGVDHCRSNACQGGVLGS
jgi:hypothetical protein